MRGAVSVALVYLYYDPDGTSDDKQKSSLISATPHRRALLHAGPTAPSPSPCWTSSWERQVLCSTNVCSRPAGYRTAMPYSVKVADIPAPGQSFVVLRLSGHLPFAHSVAWQQWISMPGIPTPQSMREANTQEVTERR